MSKRILIIDDDRGLLALLRQGLEREGFDVVTAHNGEEGFVKAFETHPTLIILDLMMPGVDGWSTYQRLRRVCDARIVVFTALATEQTIAKGLAVGVDDLITKPCSFRELSARLRDVLGQQEQDAGGRLVVFDDGHLHVDLMHGASVQGDDQVDLSPTESRLLLYLARRKGETVPHEELLINVWGPEFAEEVSYLDLYVHNLLQKIEKDPAHPQYIRARSGEGYCFAASRPVSLRSLAR